MGIKYKLVQDEEIKIREFIDFYIYILNFCVFAIFLDWVGVYAMGNMIFLDYLLFIPVIII